MAQNWIFVGDKFGFEKSHGNRNFGFELLASVRFRFFKTETKPKFGFRTSLADKATDSHRSLTEIYTVSQKTPRVVSLGLDKHCAVLITFDKNISKRFWLVSFPPHLAYISELPGKKQKKILGIFLPKIIKTYCWWQSESYFVLTVSILACVLLI